MLLKTEPDGETLSRPYALWHALSRLLESNPLERNVTFSLSTDDKENTCHNPPLLHFLVALCMKNQSNGNGNHGLWAAELFLFCL